MVVESLDCLHVMKTFGIGPDRGILDGLDNVSEHVEMRWNVLERETKERGMQQTGSGPEDFYEN